MHRNDEVLNVSVVNNSRFLGYLPAIFDLLHLLRNLSDRWNFVPAVQEDKPTELSSRCVC